MTRIFSLPICTSWQEFSTEFGTDGGDAAEGSDALLMHLESIMIGDTVLTLRCPAKQLADSVATPVEVCLDQFTSATVEPPRKGIADVNERREQAQARQLVRTLLLLSFEVAAGRRAPSHLDKLMTAPSAREAQQLRRWFAHCPNVEPKALARDARIRVCLPSRTSLEASAVVPAMPGNCIAIRMERTAQHWHCVAFEVVR